MRVAALYDIHANLPALEAVLGEVGQSEIDAIVIGGDVVPGPMPSETITRLLEIDLPVLFIRGNGDREVLASRRGEETGAVPEQFRGIIRWTAAQLRSDQERLIADWPATLRMRVPGVGDVLFCHATPRSDTEIFTRLTSEERLRPALDGVDVPTVICGHTHMPFDRTVGGIRIVNAGSVGMPFGTPGADWLLLGPDVHLRHTDYDLDSAAARIRATPYPQADEFAARNVLQPPSERDMLDAFARLEL